MPVFTQCTSLGDLVSQKHLVEVDAFAKLEEERNRRQTEIDMILAGNEVEAHMKRRRARKKKHGMKRSMSKPMKSEDAAKTGAHLKKISELVKKPTEDILQGLSPKSAPLMMTRSNSFSRSLSIVSTDSFLDDDSSFFDDPPKNTSERNQDGTQLSTSSTDSPEIRLSALKFGGVKKKARKLLLHSSYRLVSAIFGTMLAFYLIAMRLQLFLQKTCLMKDLDNIWILDLDLTRLFWLLLAVFGVFLVESLVVIALFIQDEDPTHSYMVKAAVIDVFLTVACIGLLVMAEIYRCCPCNDDGSVASLLGDLRRLASYETDDKYGSGYSSCSFKPSCCPDFGSRSCGGLGLIEPFTSLIALRLFRFFEAKHCSCCGRKVSNSDDADQLETTGEISSESAIHISNEDFSQTTGTMAELWVLALTKYSDISNTYGIFSGNMLESMLGIDPLPPGHEQEHNQSKLREGASRELGLADSIRINSTNEDVCFERPSARLVRCMRRCHCKWYPFLSDEWRLVDVVLTEHELVWFDANVEIEKLSSIEIDTLESLKQKISKGGKNLTLSDVAFGRMVLGRVSLSTLEQMNVERKLPQVSSTVKDSSLKVDHDMENMKQLSFVGSEYWSSSSYSSADESMSRWSRVEKDWFDDYTIQDKLKLNTSHGSLLLWFVEDINNAIRSAGGHIGVGIMKDYESEAYSWCKELVGLVGNAKRKQKLSHDLIEVDGRESGEDQAPFQKVLGRLFGGSF